MLVLQLLPSSTEHLTFCPGLEIRAPKPKGLESIAQKRDALGTATGGGILEDSARIIFEQFFDFVLGDTQPAEPWHEVA
jgi:hypothetical protein